MTIQKISHEQWRNFIQDVQLASFFEYPQWYSIWEKYFNATSQAYLLNDHLLVSAIKLTGAKGIVHFFNSSPAGTYSNLRSLREPTVLSAKELKALIELTSINSFRLNPFTNVTIKHRQKQLSDGHTHVLHLTHDNVVSAWSRNHKRVLNSAQESSIEIKIAKTDTDWKDYYTIYEQFKERNKSKLTNNYSKLLFDYIRHLDKQHMKLWVAILENQLIAGRLVFYTDDYAVEWHAASNENAHKLGANHLIMYHVLKDAEANGIQVYDFNPSAGLKGVERFKEKFGAVKRDTPVYKSYDIKQSLYLQYTKFIR